MENQNETVQTSELTFFQKVTGIFIDPVPVFHSIKTKPDWVKPFIIVALFSAILGLMQVIYFSDEDIEDQLMKRLDNTTLSEAEKSEQLEGAVTGAKFFMKFSPVINIVSVIIGMLVISGVLYAVYSFFLDADLTFKHTLAIYSYSSLILCLKMFLSFVMITLKGALPDMQDPLIKTNITLLLGSSIEKDSLLDLILRRIDAFSIWGLILWIIGFAIVGKVSNTKSGIAVFILYLIGSSIVVFLTYLPRMLGLQ